MAPLRHPPSRRSQHLTKDGRKEVTERNRKPEPVTSQYATPRTRNAKPRLYYMFGVVAADVVLRVQRIPAPGDHINAEALGWRVGGSSPGAW
jgi:hypothetical protein